MAITTVTVLGDEGGYGTVTFGELTGDSSRLVTVGALANSTDYEFVEWEIVVQDTTTDGSGGSGGGSGGGDTSDNDINRLVDTRE